MPLKILWVKPGKLLPLDSGGKLRTYNILRQLARSHDLTYLSYYSGSRDASYEDAIAAQLPGAVPVPTGRADTTPREQAVDYLRRLPGRAPYAVSKFTHPQVQALVRSWMASRRFDVAVCDFLSSTLNFPRELTTPTVLFQHNVETMLWERKARMESRLLDRLVSRIEYEKMRRFEPSQVRRFPHVIAVSEHDRQAMSRMVDSSRISVVPTGVDLATYQYDEHAQPEGPLVLFTGSMDWEANIDGVEYFCSEIWPRVLARVPAATFRIVGRSPHPRVRRLAGPSIDVTGSVPSIVDHLRAAAVVVVPLRIGGGTRIKIYEGMAMGKATVSTTIGAEGLDVQDGRDIRLEDEPARFADAVVTLLQEPGTRGALERAAAATARQYDWSVIAERFVETLHRTIRAAASAAPADLAEPAAARA